MKQEQIFIGASLCALMLTVVGCGSDLADSGKTPDGKVIINATARIYTVGDNEAGNLSPLWETADQMAMKVDGDTAENLTLSDGAGTKIGRFTGAITPTSGTTMMAYYPASAATATDLTSQDGTAAAAAKANVMFASTGYSTSPNFRFFNKTAILKFNMAVPAGFNTDSTLTASVRGAFCKGILGADGSWSSTETTVIRVSSVTVNSNKINGYVVVIPGSSVKDLSIRVSDGTKDYKTEAYTSSDSTIKANTMITINKTLVATEGIDMGLPSGLIWATHNVGATNRDVYGDYFAWGETTAKKAIYDWSTYKWGTSVNLEKYNKSDGKTKLEDSDDAAAANWGNGWRMPTVDDFKELFDNTTNVWTTVNGVNGRKFTSKVTGYTDKSVFFSAAGYHSDKSLLFAGSDGYYESSSLYLDASSLYLDKNFLYYMSIYSGNACLSYISRCDGLSVRPVRQN